jgi:hypothetical protein
MAAVQATGRSRWRGAAFAAGGLGGVAGAGVFAGAAMGMRSLTRARPRGHNPPAAATRVRSDGGSVFVTLDGPAADTPGVVGLVGASGRLVAGPPARVDGGWERHVSGLGGAPSLQVAADDPVVVCGDPWTDWPDPFGLSPTTEQFATADGLLTVTTAGPADGGRAIVFVHGRGGHRHTGWWLAPTAADAGWGTVMPAYRNDASGASVTGRYLLGGEWVDLAAVLGRLRARGVAEVVLVGWSMGGNICASYLRQRHRAPGAFADHPTITGLVLDAAALDWGQVLRRVASARRVRVRPPRS